MNGFEFLFGLVILSVLLLELVDLVHELSISHVKITCTLSLNLKLFVSLFQLGDWHSDSQLLEQELQLGHGVGFPLFQRVDALLHESILLSHFAIFRVVLSSEHSLLLLQILVLASDAEKIEVQDGVLLGQVNDLVLDGLLVVGAQSFEGGLNLGILVLLFLNKEFLLAHAHFKALLFLLEVALETHAVLVQLILSQQVSSDSLVKHLDFALLMADLLVLAVVNFKNFLQLELEEGMFIDMGGAEAYLAVLVIHCHVRIAELVRSTLVDLSIESFVGLWRSELPWDVSATGVKSSNSGLVDGAWRSDALCKKLLYHLSEFLVVIEQFGQLVLV